MTLRTIRKTVTFTRPFSLSGIETVQPAGTYEVETDEELLEGVSFPAYRRVATTIFLPPQPGSMVFAEMATIDPLDLEAAQERDAIAVDDIRAATIREDRRRDGILREAADAAGPTPGAAARPLRVLASRLRSSAARMTCLCLSGRAFRSLSRISGLRKMSMQGDTR